MSNDVPFHVIANVFPLMDGFQFRELVEDVRVHGLREPIVLFEGAILDGRNRYRACLAAQVALRFKNYDGKDPIAFVVSTNLHRRHLDASQRAMIAATLLTQPPSRLGRPRKEGRRDRGGRLLPSPKYPERARLPLEPEPVAPAPMTAQRAGELMQVSGRSVLFANAVRETGVPELIESVQRGDVSVSAASELAALPAEQQRRVLAAGGRQVVAIARQERTERLSARRVDRAAAEASPQAVYSHLKVGDGRAIGAVRIGEIGQLVDQLRLVADVLEAVRDYAPNDHAASVRDAVSPSVLAGIVDAKRAAARKTA